MRLSKSQIGTFETCRYKWKRFYQDGWKPPKPAPQLLKGIRIHDQIDKAVQASRNATEFEHFMKTQMDYLSAKYVKHFDNMIEYQQHNTMPVGHEVELYDEEENVVGKIDRIQISPDGEVIVFDYKTGRTKPVADFKFELYLYGWLVEKHTGLKVDKVGVIFTDEGVVDTMDFKHDEMSPVFDKIRLTRTDLQNAIKYKKFEKTKGVLCNYCDLYLQKECEGIERKLCKDSKDGSRQDKLARSK